LAALSQSDGFGARDVEPQALRQAEAGSWAASGFMPCS